MRWSYSGKKLFYFCKNHKICDKAVDNYAQALGIFLDCCKTQKICNKNVDTYSSAIKFVPDWYKTHEVRDKAVDTFPFVSDSFPDWYFFKYAFILKYYLDREP